MEAMILANVSLNTRPPPPRRSVEGWLATEEGERSSVREGRYSRPMILSNVWLNTRPSPSSW